MLVLYNESRKEMASVFNQNKVDFTKQPMFFGRTQGMQRYDEFKYPVFDKLTQKQLGFFSATRRDIVTERP